MRKMNNKKIVLIGISIVLLIIMSSSILATHAPWHIDTSRPVDTQKIDTSKSKTFREISRTETIAIAGCKQNGCYDTDGKNPLKFGIVYLKNTYSNSCDKIPDTCITNNGKSYVKEQICVELPGPGADQSLGLGLKTELIECPGGCKNGVCTSLEQDPDVQKCLNQSCYDTDGGDKPTLFGKVLLKKKKSSGQQYCVPAEDSCKLTTENGVKTWHIIEQTCKKDEVTGFLFSDPHFEKCDGLCDKGACLPPTCTDGLQNQGELGVDCGGPCDQCVTEYCKDLTGDTPNTKDFVTTKYVNGGLFDVYDKCVDNVGNEIEVTEVTPGFKKLHEKICVDNTVQNKEYDCGAYGNNDVCVDGRCIEVSCEDTDTIGLNKKLNVIEKGTFTEKVDGKVFEQGTDFCTDQASGASPPLVPEGKYLVEGACRLTNTIEDGVIINPLLCPLGCKDGACTSCVDQDQGANLFVQATTQGYTSPNAVIVNDDSMTITGITSGTDYCYVKDQNNQKNKINACKGKNCYIEEYECTPLTISPPTNSPPESTFFTATSKPCPQGCTNGACIQCPMVSVEYMTQLGLLNPSLENAIEANAFNDKIIMGDPNAPYTLILFNQYNEVFAKRWYKETFPLIKHYYIDTGKINFQIREYPILDFIQNGQQAARSTFCALEQGKYWEYINVLMSQEYVADFNTDVLLQYAQLVPLDLDAFKTCLDSPEAQAMVDKDVALAEAIFKNNGAVLIQGLPVFIMPLGLSAVEIQGAQEYPVFDKVFHYYLGECYESKACYDSDKGIDLGWDSEFGENYESGITVGYQDNGAFTKNQDLCISAAEIFGSDYNFAADPGLEQNDVGVLEGNCGNKQQEITVNSDNEFDDYVVDPTQAEWHKCDYGCIDGRCNSKQYSTCLDPDSEDIFTKGTTSATTWDNQPLSDTDSCLETEDPNSKQFQGDYVLEYICSEKTDIPYDSFSEECKFGCKDGKCECPALSWEKMESGTTSDLGAIWGDSKNDVFTVGHSGTILHYDGASWKKMESGTTQVLHSIWGSSSSDVVAVGASGTILHYDGVSWKKMESGTTQVLHSIWGSSSNDIYAVGDNGVILHYDGVNWQQMQSSTNADLSDIWGSSKEDIFVVGLGVILHYDGINWKNMYKPPYKLLRNIWGSSSNDVYAVSEFQTLHYDGNGWKKIDTGLFNPINIFGSSNTDIFGIDSDGTIINYDGISWKKLNQNSYSGVWGIWSLNNNVFFVGNNGLIVHSICVNKPTSGLSVDNCRYIKYGFDNQGNALKGSDYLLCDIHNNGDKSYNFQELGSYIEANGYHWSYVVNTDVPIFFNPGDSFTFIEQGTINAPVLNEEHCKGKDINFGIFIDKGLIEDFIFQEDVPVDCYDYNQCPTVAQTWGNLVHKQSTLISGKTGEQQTDTCAGDVLNEYICDVNQISSNQFKCPYGCNNGICLKENQCDASQLKWEKLSLGEENYLTSIWGSSSTDIFVVGTKGLILHYNGNCWEKMESGVTESLSDVHGLSANEVYTVGGNGTLLHYDGITWNNIGNINSIIPSWIQPIGIRALHVISKNSIYLITNYGQNGGNLYHYNGNTFEHVFVSDGGWNQKEIENVWASSENEVYVTIYDSGEYKAVISHFDGNTWTEKQNIPGGYLTTIWGNSNSNVFFGGGYYVNGQPIKGLLIHYNNGNWNEIDISSLNLKGMSHLYGISDKVYFGNLNQFYKYDGATFTALSPNYYKAIWDMWMSSDSNIYLVGHFGDILHYSCSPPEQLCSPIEPTNNMCQESEYGVDYFVKDYIELQEGTTKKSPADFCSATNEEFDFEELEQSMYLREAFCNGPTSDFYPINCPCTNGACGCLDTENSIYEASTAKGYETFDETTKNNPQSFIEAPDFCTAYSSLEEIKNNPVQEGNYVVEASCKNNVLVGYTTEPQLCPEGYHCQSGACVSDDACVKLTDYKKGIPKESDYQQTLHTGDNLESKSNGVLVFGYPTPTSSEPITYLKVLPQPNSLYYYTLNFTQSIDLNNQLDFSGQKHFVNFQGYEAEILDSFFNQNYFRLKLLFSKSTRTFTYPNEQFTFSLGDENCHNLQFLDKNLIYNEDPTYGPYLNNKQTSCSFVFDGTPFNLHPDEFTEVNDVLFYLNLTKAGVGNKTYNCKIAVEPRVVQFDSTPFYETSTISVNNVIISDVKPSVYRNNPWYPNLLFGFGYNYTPQKNQFLQLGDSLVDPLLEAFSIKFDHIDDKDKEEISFVGGSTSAEITFTNSDGQEVTLPLSADADCLEKGGNITSTGIWNSNINTLDSNGVGTTAAYNASQAFTYHSCIGQSGTEPVFWGTDAPISGDQNQDQRMYMDKEFCWGKLAGQEGNVYNCKNAYFLVISPQHNAHLMQIQDININKSIDLKDVSYGADYNDLKYAENGTSSFDLGSDIGIIKLNISDIGIHFTSINSPNEVYIETLQKGKIFINNTNLNSTYFEGIAFNEFNDGSLPDEKYLNYPEFKVGAYYDDIGKDVIKFNRSSLLPPPIKGEPNPFGFGWYPVSKTIPEFEVFMTYKGTKIIYDAADKKSLLIDHPSKAVLAKLYFISKPDNYAAIGLGSQNIPSHGLHYNQTLNQFDKYPFTKEPLPVLLENGEIK